jgi:tetratricopeptide (TPR) repeat protein
MPDGDHFDFDVFVSYNSRDKEWVRGELLNRIEQAGLKAFIDYRDFTRGAPSIKECERGVVKCRKTLIVLTPDYLQSGWGEFENIMVQTLDPANESLRLLPLLRIECKKPLRIGALTHIDFTDGADLDLAWRQLLTALGKPPEPEPPKEPQRAEWFLAHPYPMPPNFTGRVDERKMLTLWLEADAAHPLLSLRALGGFGKSALVWHWLMNDVSPAAWPRVIWWSFYEGDASFDHFLESSVDYLKAGNQAELGPRQRLGLLLTILNHSGTLLVLDGVERALRLFGGLDAAYQGDAAVEPAPNERDCISPLTEIFLRSISTLPGIRAKILLTTRLCPHVLEAKGGGFLQGSREEELKQMQPADAVGFFRAQGIRGTHTEIEQACEPYGYHPLSLRLLAGLIVGDFQQPGDIAAAKRLDVCGDLVQRQNHVLKVAYDSLTPARQSLLGRIACFRGSVKYEALKALAETEFNIETQRRKGPKEEAISASLPLCDFALNLNADLRDLLARGLLHHNKKESRFDLHPIVRRYAYDRLAAPDRAAAHTHLRNYFAAVPKPDKVTRLEDLSPLIELYHHTVRAGKFDEAFALFRERLSVATYYQLGAYQLIIDLLRALFPEGDDHPSRLSEESDQAWTLNSLANSHSFSGQPYRAVPLFELANAINERAPNKRRLSTGLANLAQMAQIHIGALRAAEANLRRSIALAREINEELQEAAGEQELGRLLAYRGAWAESEMELETALKTKVWRESPQFHGANWAYRALRELLQLRCASNSPLRTPYSALESARHALELADEDARTRYAHERDYVQAHWLLGAAHRAAGQTDEAEHHLHEALERCRRINCVESEAHILVDIARLRAATGAPDEAYRLAEEALLISERSGYVLQWADAHLELAKLALARGDKATAKDHAQKAKDLATCDGPPDYTYKAAYDEAEVLLRG